MSKSVIPRLLLSVLWLLPLLLLEAESWRFEFYEDPSCTGPLSHLVAPNPIKGDKVDVGQTPASNFPGPNFTFSSCRGSTTVGFGIQGVTCVTQNDIGVHCNEKTGELFDAFMGTLNSNGKGAYGDHWIGYAERGCQRFPYPNIHRGGNLPPMYVIGYMENNTCQQKPVEWEWTLQYFLQPDCTGDASEHFSPNVVKGLSTWTPYPDGPQALVNHHNYKWEDYDKIHLMCPKNVDGGYAPYLYMWNRMRDDEYPKPNTTIINYYFNGSRCQAVPLGHFGGSTQYYMKAFTSLKSCPCSYTDQSLCSTVTTTQFDAPDREPLYWIPTTTSTSTSSSTSTTTVHSGSAWTWQLYFDHGNCTNPTPSVTGRGDQCVADLSPSLVSHQLQCLGQQLYIVEFDNGHVPGVSSPSCSAIPLDKATWYGPLGNGTTQPLLTLDYATKNASVTPFCMDFLFDGCCDSNDQVVRGPCTTTTTSIGMATPSPRTYATPAPLSGQATPPVPQGTTYAAPTHYAAVATPSTAAAAAYAVPTPLPVQGTPQAPSHDLASYTGPVPAVLLLYTPPPSMTHAWTSLTTSLDAVSAANLRAVAASVSSSSSSSPSISSSTVTTTTTTTTSEMPWGVPWWGWFLLCCGLLALCLLCTAICGGGAATATAGGKSTSAAPIIETTYEVVDEPDAVAYSTFVPVDSASR